MSPSYRLSMIDIRRTYTNTNLYKLTLLCFYVMEYQKIAYLDKSGNHISKRLLKNLDMIKNLDRGQ